MLFYWTTCNRNSNYAIYHPHGTLLRWKGGAVNDEAGAAGVIWDGLRQTGMSAYPRVRKSGWIFSTFSFSCMGFLPISLCTREGTQLLEDSGSSSSIYSSELSCPRIPSSLAYVTWPSLNRSLWTSNEPYHWFTLGHVPFLCWRHRNTMNQQSQ